MYSLNASPSDQLFPCGNTKTVTQTAIHCMVPVETPVTRLSLGHLHSIALCLYLCSHSHLGAGWESHCRGHGPDAPFVACGQSSSPCSQHPLTLAPAQPAGRRSGSHQHECVQAGRVGPLQTHRSRSTPISMCEVASSLSLQGSDLPSKKTTSTFFFCILINTEEAGAVKFILGKPQNWFIWCRETS